MRDLKSAVDAACTARSSIGAMAARGGSLAVMKTVARAADSAVFVSGHLRHIGVILCEGGSVAAA